jgi:hypothetical protein
MLAAPSVFDNAPAWRNIALSRFKALCEMQLRNLRQEPIPLRPESRQSPVQLAGH